MRNFLEFWIFFLWMLVFWYLKVGVGIYIKLFGLVGESGKVM